MPLLAQLGRRASVYKATHSRLMYDDQRTPRPEKLIMTTT